MKQAHIVVVDDEPSILLLCERVLERAGYTLDTFNDSTVALEFLRKTPADLLLVDIRMPVIGGFELIQDAHKRQPDMAILVMTGFGTVESAIEALRQGVDGLILKPFNKNEDLINAVKLALEDNQKKRDVAVTQAIRPLFDVTEALLAETRPEQLFKLIISAVCAHLKCSNAGFYQYAATDQSLHLAAARGNALPETRSGVDAGMVGRVHAQQTPLWATAASIQDKELKNEMDKAHLTAAICVPTYLAQIQSVIYAGRDKSEPPFREVDLELLTILARQATIAVENAQLYEELRAYVRRVEESQQALIQSEKMATAGRLTASIAHEINNPLQSLRNCLHLAERQDLPPAKRQEYLTLAQSELERLSETTQRMLNFYRPSVAREPVLVVDLFEHVFTLMHGEFEKRGVEVIKKFPRHIMPVDGVPSQIEQVFINLILNAFDAMPDGGKLTITIRSAKNALEILFQDTGIGIASEIHDSLFEPFNSTKPGGTGLGLSVSYGIITAHGGTLDVLENNEPGACFRIILPTGDKHES